ncbi:hypothetical protein [Pedobacter agri]|uniref:hypothetical protein n=1 Tax=Pedobacter agri TaxID=454586 RepID=UPI0029314378|nr:hypothetical protein [Pedobacter agri]
MATKEQVVIEILKAAQTEDQENFIYAVPNIFTRKVKSYMLIREDLKFLIEIVDILIDLKKQANQNDTLSLALWQSLIVTYGKCFTENKAGMSKLEQSVFENQDEVHRAVHESLMSLRHSYIAHRDDMESEQAIVFMKIPKDKDIVDFTEYQIKSVKLVSPGLAALENYRKLFDVLMSIVEVKIQTHTQKAHSAFLANIPPELSKYLLINNMK